MKHILRKEHPKQPIIKQETTSTDNVHVVTNVWYDPVICDILANQAPKL
jgi:hypothetical protein